MRLILILAGVLALAACGSGAAVLPAPPDGGGGATPPPIPGDQPFALSVLRNASGAPSGVRVSWTRVDTAGVQGYYLYRATASGDLPDGGPAGYESYRRNDGNMISQSGSGTQTLTFDDNFSGDFGEHYWYRMTVVNATTDESDFSGQLDILFAEQTITSITTDPVGIGDEVVITGTHFGGSRAGDHVYFSHHGGSTPDVVVADADYISWADTEIHVKVPYGAADGPLGVMISTTQVDSDDDIAYREPVITDMDPDQDWVQHNAVTITGTDFGDVSSGNGYESYVYFDATPTEVGDIVSWTATEIQVLVPAAAEGIEVSVMVSVAGNDSNSDFTFTLLPHVDGITPDHGQTLSEITLGGTNLGAAQGGGTVLVDGIAAAVQSWSNTAVVVTVPAVALDGPVELTRDDAKAADGVPFDVVPVITGFSPMRRMVGEQLTITGSGFGANRGASTVTFNGGSVVVGPAGYTNWTPSQIVIMVPPGAGTGTLTVHIDDDDVGANYDDATTQTNVAILLPPPDITDIGQFQQ